MIFTSMDIDFFASLTDAAGFIAGEADMAPYAREWRGTYSSYPLAVLRPRNTQEVSAMVGMAAAHGIAIVPQGGNTGLVGGSVALEDNPGVIINLGRMNAIRAIDPVDCTMVVEAGCILQNLQAAAEAVDRILPLSLAAEGSCQIGGNLSSNAGGVLTLRHGNARSLVLGLEVVLPDGRIWNGLRALRKDNTGYDLKQLFIGAEGTLGIITAAVLKLSPKPATRITAFAAVDSPQRALELLDALRQATGDAVEAFELIPRLALELVTANMPGASNPLVNWHAWYVVLEVTSGMTGSHVREAVEQALSITLDAVIAESEAQRRSLWYLRESIPESQKFLGGMIPHDVAVPVSKIPSFIASVSGQVEALIPGTRPMPFGHVGDGNMHFVLARPETMDGTVFLARREELSAIVYDIAVSLDGSISAEHGIGLAKRDQLAETKSTIEMELMMRIKAAIDPACYMNPGKIMRKG